VAALKNLEPGEFVEGHELEREHIRKIRKEMIRKCLSPRQSQQLLNSLSR
jgi:hypothetical protein